MISSLDGLDRLCTREEKISVVQVRTKKLNYEAES